MKPHFDQALPPSWQACRWPSIALSQPSGCLGARNGKQTLKEKPGPRFAPLYPWEKDENRCKSRAAPALPVCWTHPSCFGCYWKKVLSKCTRKIWCINLCFLTYRLPESKSDESFGCHWNADQVTEVWFQRHIPIFLNFQNEMLLMTGQVSYEFPQAPSLLTDSVNVLIKALTEK